MRAVLLAVALFSALAAGATVSADPPESKEKPRPLTGKELSGRWQGEKGGLKIQIAFRGTEDATWQVNTPSASIAASLKRVDDKKSGTVHLRVDYVETATGKKGSAVVGHLERDESGTLRLTILSEATKHGGYKPVEKVALTEVTDKKA